jgi:DNA-directed RNA polymerase subunit RPC12/RpoP
MKRVSWEIDVDAGTAAEAAIQALNMIRKSDTTATVFDVTGADGKTERVDLAAQEIPVVCLTCGSDNVAQVNVVPGYAAIQAIRLDGAIIWAGDTQMDWDGQRPASNPPEYICRTCGASVDLAAVIAKAVRAPTHKRRKRRC